VEGPTIQSFKKSLQEERLMIASTEIRKTGAMWVAVLVILLAGTWSHAQSQSAPAAGKMSELRILYAGHPGSDREKDFVAFLKKCFDVVQTGDLQTFKEADAQGFDVTILDYDADTFNAPCPTLSPLFSKPVITVGTPGGFMGRRWRLKTGYF
jgi:hypothetical protein